MAAPVTSPIRKCSTHEKRALFRDILDGARKNDERIIDAIMSGLPTTVLADLARAGLCVSEVARIVGLSERTLHRKLKRGAAGSLNIVQSDRAIRLARILAEADQYIGDHEKALRWLRADNWALGNRLPLDLLVAEPGVESVQRSLAMIAYGGVV